MRLNEFWTRPDNAGGTTVAPGQKPLVVNGVFRKKDTNYRAQSH